MFVLLILDQEKFAQEKLKETSQTVQFSKS